MSKGYTYMHASLKLLNFTTSLYIPYFFVVQSIEYHRLRQARSTGHDMQQTNRERERKKICSSSPRSSPFNVV